MRLRQRSTVLLPQPDGPMKAVILFFSTGMSAVADRKELAVVELVDLAVDGRRRGRGGAPLAAAPAVGGLGRFDAGHGFPSR